VSILAEISLIKLLRRLTVNRSVVYRGLGVKMHCSKDEFSERVDRVFERLRLESKKTDKGLQCMVMLQICRELYQLIDEYLLLSSSFADNNN
jgi:hypothetical protein